MFVAGFLAANLRHCRYTLMSFQVELRAAGKGCEKVRGDGMDGNSKVEKHCTVLN